MTNVTLVQELALI